MSLDSLIDSSKEIFEVDKDIITFKIDFKNNDISEELTAIDEQEVIITNLTQNYLAFQIKITKKKFYAVNPSYCILSPNEKKNIKIIFYNVPNEELNAKKHKFRFEGFIILDNEKDKDSKELFSEYIKKGNKIEGNIIIKSVKFINEEKKEEKKEEKQNQTNILEEKLENLPEEKMQSKNEENIEDKNKDLQNSKKIEIENNKQNNSKYLIIGGVLILLVIVFYLFK